MGCNLKTTKFLDCAIIGVCRAIWLDSIFHKIVFASLLKKNLLQCLLSEKGSFLRGRKFFPFRTDPFSEGSWCVGKNTESHTIVFSLVKQGQKSTKYIQSPKCVFSVYIYFYIDILGYLVAFGQDHN